ncbi:hypothetical protein [Mycobacterium asiaticum]|nr:hypothetical protein [Mycobacterium asiaticum]
MERSAVAGVWTGGQAAALVAVSLLALDAGYAFLLGLGVMAWVA